MSMVTPSPLGSFRPRVGEALNWAKVRRLTFPFRPVSPPVKTIVALQRQNGILFWSRDCYHTRTQPKIVRYSRRKRPGGPEKEVRRRPVGGSWVDYSIISHQTSAYFTVWSRGIIPWVLKYYRTFIPFRWWAVGPCPGIQRNYLVIGRSSLVRG